MCGKRLTLMVNVLGLAVAEEVEGQGTGRG